MLKKFKEKITKKNLLIASGIAIALVAIIIAIEIGRASCRERV